MKTKRPYLKIQNKKNSFFRSFKETMPIPNLYYVESKKIVFCWIRFLTIWGILRSNGCKKNCKVWHNFTMFAIKFSPKILFWTIGLILYNVNSVVLNFFNLIKVFVSLRPSFSSVTYPCYSGDPFIQNMKNHMFQESQRKSSQVFIVFIFTKKLYLCCFAKYAC